MCLFNWRLAIGCSNVIALTHCVQWFNRSGVTQSVSQWTGGGVGSIVIQTTGGIIDQNLVGEAHIFFRGIGISG